MVIDIITWVLSGLLAAFFAFAAINKLVVPRAKLVTDPRMGWANDFSQTQIRAIAVLELLAAIGLIVPWLTGILPVLTPLAAVGLAIIMLVATIVVARRGDKAAIPMNVVLGLIAVAIAVLRFTQL